MAEVRLINNLKGILYYLNTPLLNFDEYIKHNNGNNNLDNYWVKFEDFGARCFEDFLV